MTDENAARLMPLYRDVKQLLSSISSGTGVYYAASQLTDLIEKAVLADGKIDRVRIDISANDLLVHARLLAERAEAIKAMLDEVAS
jgi:hypothetical protein